MSNSKTMVEQSLYSPEPSRRDFLYIATGSVAAVGAGLGAWPFLDSMNPSVDITSVATIEINLEPIKVGQRVTFRWRGQPVFVDHRSPQRIAAAQADDTADLKDPERDSARVQREEWLIVVGVCTHLGCIPLGQAAGNPLGEWGGWFCPCHGSHYDTSGRIRKGPAPLNLVVPDYKFIADTMVRIG